MSLSPLAKHSGEGSFRAVVEQEARPEEALTSVCHDLAWAVSISYLFICHLLSSDALASCCTERCLGATQTRHDPEAGAVAEAELIATGLGSWGLSQRLL